MCVTVCVKIFHSVLYYLIWSENMYILININTIHKVSYKLEEMEKINELRYANKLPEHICEQVRMHKYHKCSHVLIGMYIWVTANFFV